MFIIKTNGCSVTISLISIIIQGERFDALNQVAPSIPDLCKLIIEWENIILIKHFQDDYTIGFWKSRYNNKNK